TAQFSAPFTVTDFVPTPVLGVYKTSPHSNPVPLSPGNPPSYSLTANSTYYLWDDETIPGGGAHPGVTCYKSSDSNPTISGGDTQIGSSAGAGPVTFVAAACSSSCYIKAQVLSNVGAFKYSATSSTPPPPPPPPPGGVAVSGPSTGAVNVSYT